MIKKILWLGAASLLFIGKPSLPVLATADVSSEIVTSSEDATSSQDTILGSSEQSLLPDILNDQLDTIEQIIVALMVSFTGTGTIALIGRFAISSLTKKIGAKIAEAENQNKISTKQAQDALAAMVQFEQILKAQVDALDKSVKELVDNQNISNETIKLMLDEFKQRDEQIKALIVKEFGDDTND